MAFYASTMMVKSQTKAKQLFSKENFLKKSANSLPRLARTLRAYLMQMAMVGLINGVEMVIIEDLESNMLLILAMMEQTMCNTWS